MGGRHDHLETVLPRVAGAGDEQIAGFGGGEPPECRNPRAIALRQQRQHRLARLRALHRDHRQVRALGHADAVRRRMTVDPRQVLLAGGGIDHQAEVVLAHVVDDQVVDHAALLVQHAGVERLARHLELVDIVRDQMAQERAAAVAVQVDHGHVRDIEHPGAAAHDVVLVDLRTVVQRHVPAAEIDHLGAQLAMASIQRRLREGHGEAPVRERGLDDTRAWRESGLSVVGSEARTSQG